MNIRLFAPYLGDEELNEIRDSFSKSWIGLGQKVSAFEKAFEKYIGCRKSVAVNSATAALHLALSVYRFKAGSKVLVPDITFASTAFAPVYNSLEPVFVDVYSHDVTMSVEDMEKKYSKDCVAVMPVHYGGQPAHMDRISEFAKNKNLKVIEDCAHTIGATYKDRKLGLWGDIGCYSFEEKKAMTTGDGGMICSDDDALINELSSKRWLGIDKESWKIANPDEENEYRHWYYDIDDLGFKYNMNDLSASIGLVQLKKLDSMNRKRSAIIRMYLDGLRGLKKIRPILPFEPEIFSYWLFGVRCAKRDDLIKFLKDSGIATGVHYVPLNMVNYFRKWNSACPIAERIWKEFVTLPLHVQLKDEEVYFVLKKLSEFEKNHL
ncbi:MAG: DegT/DnrJ/EryC1/StrS aminotransferase family protein [Bacteroidetes bacterium]|nr:DegT/DnrJ/EryC1/StrS aminotransferase family protein [Bacteroidota bacterium]